MSVRSSPDLSYAIGALGREVTKHPRWARTVGWLSELEAEGLTLMMACPHGVKSLLLGLMVTRMVPQTSSVDERVHCAGTICCWSREPHAHQADKIFLNMLYKLKYQVVFSSIYLINFSIACFQHSKGKNGSLHGLPPGEVAWDLGGRCPSSSK